MASDKPVTVTIDGTVMVVPRRLWNLWMQAVNHYVDTGDAILLFDDRFTHDELVLARELSLTGESAGG